MTHKRGILDSVGGTIALAVIAVCMIWVVPAYAADKGGPKGQPNFLDIPGSNPKSQWTGCGVGVYGSVLNGDVEITPFTMGSNGHEAGVSAGCDVAMGAFVAGVGVDYGRVFGDLNTIGLDAAMSGYVRGGVLVSANTLAYALIARSRLDTTAGELDGWQFGGGLEAKLPSAPLFLRLEYRNGTYDLSDIGGPPVDAEVQTVRLGVTYKFGAK